MTENPFFGQAEKVWCDILSEQTLYRETIVRGKGDNHYGKQNEK